MMVNEVIYNSGVNIHDPHDTATLVVFYEKVWLPHVQTSRVPVVEFTRFNNGKYELTAISGINYRFRDQNGKEWSVDRFTNDWVERHKCLLEAGVLQRIAEPKDDPINKFLEIDYVDFRVMLNDLHTLIDDIPFALRSNSPDGTQKVLIWQDHANHLLRNDIDKPAVFVMRYRTTPRRLMHEHPVRLNMVYKTRT